MSEVLLREVRQSDGVFELRFLVERDGEVTGVSVPVDRRGGFTFPHHQCSSGESLGHEADQAVCQKAHEVIATLKAAHAWAKHARGPA